LIEKGWKPFGRKKTLHITIYDCDLSVYLDWWFMNEDKKSFRELVSKESWLWQFVCENRLQPTNKSGGWDYGDWFTWWTCMAYEYRLIETALTDEDKLEEFLLENIKL
jgi:hypothetical protein